MRLRSRTDANHAEVGRALRQIGASVLDIHNLGRGCGDFLVGFRGLNILIEVKDGAKAKSQRKLTPAEKMFSATWAGRPPVVVEDEHEAVMAVFREANRMEGECR